MLALLKRARALAVPPPPRPAPAAAGLDDLEAAMLAEPQVPLEFVHHFARDIYAREMRAPAGALVLGHAHKTECLNIVLAGRARVFVDGAVREVRAGDVFVSPAGARKLGYVLEPLRFLNIHANPTNTRDLAAIEAATVDHSAAFRLHAALEARELRALVGEGGAS